MPEPSTFTVDPGSDLTETLANLPPDFKAYLKLGFRTLTKIAEDRYMEVVSLAAEEAPAGRLMPARRKILADRLGLSQENVSPLTGAISMLISMLVGNPETTPEHFVSAALLTGLADEGNKGPLSALANIVVKQRPLLKQNATRAHLGSRLLPSLSVFSSLVDIRPSIKGTDIEFAIPIALLYMKTDGDHRMWVQLMKSELNQLINDLQETMRQMEQAERWIERRDSKE